MDNNDPWKIIKRVERGLFLFRLDYSGWTKATDKLLQVDYEDYSLPNEPYLAYFPWRVTGDRPENEKEFVGALIYSTSYGQKYMFLR